MVVALGEIAEETDPVFKASGSIMRYHWHMVRAA